MASTTKSNTGKFGTSRTRQTSGPEPWSNTPFLRHRRNCLKQHAPTLKVGGPAISHDFKFLERFLPSARSENLSWISAPALLHRTPDHGASAGQEVRRLLEK